jgi:hypothetical protein
VLELVVSLLLYVLFFLTLLVSRCSVEYSKASVFLALQIHALLAYRARVALKQVVVALKCLKLNVLHLLECSQEILLHAKQLLA